MACCQYRLFAIFSDHLQSRVNTCSTWRKTEFSLSSRFRDGTVEFKSRVYVFVLYSFMFYLNIYVQVGYIIQLSDLKPPFIIINFTHFLVYRYRCRLFSSLSLYGGSILFFSFQFQQKTKTHKNILPSCLFYLHFAQLSDVLSKISKGLATNFKYLP